MAPKSQRWVEYDFDGPWEIPFSPGVYAIYGNGHLVYIGQSICVAKRVAQYGFRWAYSHSIITPWGYFNTVHVKVRSSQRFGDWAMIELRLIRKLRPPANSTGSVRKRGDKYLCGMASDWNIQKGSEFKHAARGH